MSPIFIFLVFLSAATTAPCPQRCVCRSNQHEEIKLRCGDTTKITSIEEIDLSNISNKVGQLNLSNNEMETFNLKVPLPNLQKLDLSGNKLTQLSNNQFALLPNLRRLDLSGNNIKLIHTFAFVNLTKLERLKLSRNQISTITLGTFDFVSNLKQLDITSNPLNCDCALLWILEWSQTQSVKLVSNPTCSSPPPFKGFLRKLKIGNDINCKTPVIDKFTIKMIPKFNQVVFEGDKLELQCEAPSISDSYESGKIIWSWMGSDPKLYFKDVTIEDHFLQSTGIITSNLFISKLHKNHTGIWGCFLQRQNHLKDITVVVISNETKYCPISVTKNNKGLYTWPRTVVNYTATLPCQSLNLNYDLSEQKASYFCGLNGQWINLNTSLCAYISETTKIFEQFSKVNSSIVESAKHFRNYTSNVEHFQDVMDVVFVVKTMENYFKQLSVAQLGGILMDVTNNLLLLPKKYLRDAEVQYGCCRKLVEITEKLPNVGLTFLPHKNNIALETFPVKKNTFSNLRCVWYADVNRIAEHMLTCKTNYESEISEIPEIAGKTIEASITIPETLFQQLEDQNEIPDKNYNLLIAMHSNSNFFPVDNATKDVTSAVVGTKLAELNVVNLTDPVFIALKTPKFDKVTPVWWDPSTHKWSPEHCQLSHESQEHVYFFCNNFGYYGLMQDIQIQTNNFAKFKLSHPAIYVGSFIFLSSLSTVTFTYLMFYNSIQMPKKAKHSIINLWIALMFLCFFYLFGIYQTESLKICQIVGILIHYFTLSSLLWICVGVNCMYKKLSKSEVMELQDEELVEPIKKPIIGLYFVGWGISIIICGITAAINIREYSTPDYCFLKSGPPLSALYIPVTILLVFLIILFLLIRCAIYNLDTNGHLSEGTQATENVDLDLLEPNFSPEARSVSSRSSETEDSEHGPLAQLKAYIIILFLTILSWLSCALATIKLDLATFETDLFATIYAILCTFLSAFVVFFYCVARSDVRHELMVFCKRKQIFRSRNVSDTVHIQPLPMPPEVVQASRSSSRSSSRTKSNSQNSNILKQAVDLNGPVCNDRINNVNLIMLHRQQYRTSVIPNIIENPTNAEVFYNPHQSIVARKFFKRQKRHLKRNNLVPRTRDSDSASVVSKVKDNSSLDHSIFATSSKVNNANIHVESKNYERKKHKSRKKFQDRSQKDVSQQCTLEYSSENISDSILDRVSLEFKEDNLDKENKLSEISESVDSNPRIFVNPTYQLPKVQSVSDVDDLYQQIRRPKHLVVRSSPCFSDPDIRGRGSGVLFGDDIETTV